MPGEFPNIEPQVLYPVHERFFDIAQLQIAGTIDAEEGAGRRERISDQYGLSTAEAMAIWHNANRDAEQLAWYPATDQKDE